MKKLNIVLLATLLLSAFAASASPNWVAIPNTSLIVKDVVVGKAGDASVTFKYTVEGTPNDAYVIRYADCNTGDSVDYTPITNSTEIIKFDKDSAGGLMNVYLCAFRETML